MHVDGYKCHSNDSIQHIVIVNCVLNKDKMIRWIMWLDWATWNNICNVESSTAKLQHKEIKTNLQMMYEQNLFINYFILTKFVQYN